MRSNNSESVWTAQIPHALHHRMRGGGVGGKGLGKALHCRGLASTQRRRRRRTERGFRAAPRRVVRWAGAGWARQPIPAGPGPAIDFACWKVADWASARYPLPHLHPDPHCRRRPKQHSATGGGGGGGGCTPIAHVQRRAAPQGGGSGGGGEGGGGGARRSGTLRSLRLGGGGGGCDVKVAADQEMNATTMAGKKRRRLSALSSHIPP
jgi:hypothetical protein